MTNDEAERAAREILMETWGARVERGTAIVRREVERAVADARADDWATPCVKCEELRAEVAALKASLASNMIALGEATLTNDRYRAALEWIGVRDYGEASNVAARALEGK